MTPSSRPLAWGLIVTGAVLAAIVLLWLVVQLAGGHLTSGGAVLGLLLAAVLGLPLAGGGFYLLSRGSTEVAEASANERLRSLLERDRALALGLVPRPAPARRRLDSRGGSGLLSLAARLNDLAEDLEVPGTSARSGQTSRTLAARQALGRYDDLVSTALGELAKQIQDIEAAPAGSPGSAERLQTTLNSLEQDLSARGDLLAGRAAPTVAAADLMARGETGAADVAGLAPGDAVSRDGVDYLVETSASYFAGWLNLVATSFGGRAWQRLAGGRAGRLEPGLVAAHRGARWSPVRRRSTSEISATVWRSPGPRPWRFAPARVRSPAERWRSGATVRLTVACSGWSAGPTARSRSMATRLLRTRSRSGQPRSSVQTTCQPSIVDRCLNR